MKKKHVCFLKNSSWDEKQLFLLFPGVEIHILKKSASWEKILVGTEKLKKKKFVYGVWGLILSRYDIK